MQTFDNTLATLTLIRTNHEARRERFLQELRDNPFTTTNDTGYLQGITAELIQAEEAIDFLVNAAKLDKDGAVKQLAIHMTGKILTQSRNVHSNTNHHRNLFQYELIRATGWLFDQLQFRLPIMAMLKSQS